MLSLATSSGGQYERTSQSSEPVKPPTTNPATTIVDPLERICASAPFASLAFAAKYATRSRRSSEKHEPRKHDTGITQSPAATSPNFTAIAEKSAPPPTMPRMYGSASGFLRTPCSTAPETASEAPTTVAARTARSTPKRYLPALSADLSARILGLSSDPRNLPPGLSHSCSTLHPCHSRNAWYVQSKPHSSKMDATSAI